MGKIEELEPSIASQLGKVLSDHFGRGPKSILVLIRLPFISVYLEDFLAPMEKVLLRQGDTQKVEQLREQMMAEIVPYMTNIFKTEMDMDVLDVYYDWNLRPSEDCTGSIWAIMNTPDEQRENFSWPSTVSKKMLQRQIHDMSTKAQKSPETMNLYWLGARQILVERTGIFLEIEQALMDYGHEETLKVVKRPLEKKIFNKHVLESVLHTTIQETFVDWHMTQDKGYLLIYLQKERKGKKDSQYGKYV